MFAAHQREFDLILDLLDVEGATHLEAPCQRRNHLRGQVLDDIVHTPRACCSRTLDSEEGLGQSHHDLRRIVPHLASRRIRHREALETRIANLAEQGGVSDVLVIGGGLDTPVGPNATTMDLLETGLLDRFGIKDIAVAGHPEGSPDFTEERAIEVLRQKQAFSNRTGVCMRIVTQFGFDPASAVA